MQSATPSTNPKITIICTLLSLFGAPVAWVVQMSLSEIISSYACYPHTMPISTPLLTHLTLWLAIISGATFIMGIISSISALDGWRKTSAFKASENRTRFLALLGILSSSLFFIAILFTASAFLMVSPCGS